MNKVLREVKETLEAFLLIGIFFIAVVIILFMHLIAVISNKHLI